MAIIMDLYTGKSYQQALWGLYFAEYLALGYFDAPKSLNLNLNFIILQPLKSRTISILYEVRRI